MVVVRQEMMEEEEEEGILEEGVIIMVVEVALSTLVQIKSMSLASTRDTEELPLLGF